MPITAPPPVDPAPPLDIVLVRTYRNGALAAVQTIVGKGAPECAVKLAERIEAEDPGVTAKWEEVVYNPAPVDVDAKSKKAIGGRLSALTKYAVAVWYSPEVLADDDCGLPDPDSAGHVFTVHADWPLDLNGELLDDRREQPLGAQLVDVLRQRSTMYTRVADRLAAAVERGGVS